MKSLFFVSVAVGIVSGTSITAKAQTSINLMRVNAEATKSNPPKFIEGIEAKRDAGTSDVKTINMTLTVPKAALSPATPGRKGSAVSEDAAAIEKCSSLQFKYAQLLNIEVEEIKDLALYSFIDDWWATRYRYGGSTRKGIDCSAFTGTLLSEVYGLNPPRTARDQYDASEKIERESLQEGDLVFFNTTGGVSHVGIYLANGYFVHSSVHSGVTISSLDDEYYNKKFIEGRRFVTKSSSD